MAATPRRIGSAGESIAREYLEAKGWRFVEANWLCKAGEIDLIMIDGSTRVFVEVRFRAGSGYGGAAETISWQKQRKLLRTARWYQQQENYWGDIRFDVVCVGTQDDSYSIEHIEGAFTE